ncbi:MAG TPA: hypothetical protein VND64_22625 [Pirellulales bacterium]|nr:hypothetical protein [Pirellulales bacterium]
MIHAWQRMLAETLARSGASRRLQARLHGRRTLAWAVVVYAALQLGVTLTIDSADPDLRDTEYGHRLALLRAKQAECPDRPLLFALGSSRTLYGFRPDALGESADGPLAFNFGGLGAGPIVERIFLDRLLAEDLRPHWLVIEIHPALLHPAPYGHERRKRSEVQRFSFRDIRLLSRFVGAPPALWADWLALRLGGCYWYRAALLSQRAPSWMTAPRHRDPHGFERVGSLGWVPGPWRIDDEAVRRKNVDGSIRRFAGALRDFRVGDGERRALRDMLDICRREHIEVCLCLMPEATRFRHGYPARTRRQVDALTDELRSEFGVKVIDAGNWCGDRCFVDGEHLLAAGATKFSQRFAHEVLRPWLAGPTARR